MGCFVDCRFLEDERTSPDSLKSYGCHPLSMVGKRVMILMGVVVVAAVAIAAYALLSDPGKGDDDDRSEDLTPVDPGKGDNDNGLGTLPPVESGTYESEAGDTMKYMVFGTNGSMNHLEGTMTVTVLDQNEIQKNVRTEWAVDEVDEDGGRTSFRNSTQESWVDKVDEDYEKSGTWTLRTLWGQEDLDCYDEIDGIGFKLVKGDIMFAQYFVSDGYRICLELMDCDSFTQKKIEREIYSVELRHEGTNSVRNSSVDTTYVWTFSNENSEIFKTGTYAYTYTYLDNGEEKSSTTTSVTAMGPKGNMGQYSDINGNTDYDTSYVEFEHTTETIKTAWGSLEVDVYTASYTVDGIEATTALYLYSGLLMKYVDAAEASGISATFEYELTSATANGDDVELDDVVSFCGLMARSD